jgi:quinol monooxygenase YgiN
MTLLDDVLLRLPAMGEVNIILTCKIVPGKQEEAEEILKEMEAGTLANDKGCLRYEWNRSDAPHTYILLERWADRAAVLSHLQAPHMVAISSRMASIAVGDLTFACLSKL